MFLLFVSTGKFLLIAFAVLCLYELGVFLYFKFVKGGDSHMSKNDLRKRKEIVSDKPVQRQVSHPSTKGNGGRGNGDSSWEDLIDYRKSARSSSAPVSSEVYPSPVIDAYSPADTHADFSRLDKAHRGFVEDLLGSTTVSDADVSTGPAFSVDEKSMTFGEACSQDKSANIEVPQSFEGKKDISSDLKNTFSEMDFSNMMN